MQSRKIGIFDSGLGGLLVARAVRKMMPQYDYVYLGDVKNLPYGEKTEKEIYKNTQKALTYLFKNKCEIVVIACNTVSAESLRRIQQEWLPKSIYKDRKVLGVIRPTAELVGKYKNIGLIGTRRTVESGTYKEELKIINPKIKLTDLATPKLVPMVEDGEYDMEILKKYLVPFRKVDALILACTHYGLLKKEIRKILGTKPKIITQEDLLPRKLKIYLKKHLEITKKLSKRQSVEILVTKINSRYKNLAQKWFGGKVKLKLIKL